MSIVIIPKDAFDEKDLLSNVSMGKVPHNAISWSAENGYAELTKLLIEFGAEVNENGNYPLELASKNGHTRIVKILLDAGAKTSDSGGDEGCCLRMASWRGYVGIVKMLLNAGANPMADNYFALRFALDKGHMEVVEILLDAIYKKRKSSRIRKK